MKNRLERLYKSGRLSKDGLFFYVKHGFLTEEEYNEIVGPSVKEETKK